MTRKIQFQLLLIMALAMSFSSLTAFQDEGIWGNDRLRFIADEIIAVDPDLTGIDFTLQQAPAHGKLAVALLLNSMVEVRTSPDIIRLVLSSVSKLSELEPRPALLVIWARGEERLFLEGLHLAVISSSFKAESLDAAWLAFMEKATMPDGSAQILPDDPVARAAAATAAVELILPVVESDMASFSEPRLLVQTVFIPLNESDKFLLDFKTEIVETTGKVFQYSWKIQLKNKHNQPLRLSLRILFYDAAGVVVDTFEGDEVLVGANEEKILQGEKKSAREIGVQIRRVMVHIMQN